MPAAPTKDGIPLTENRRVTSYLQKEDPALFTFRNLILARGGETRVTIAQTHRGWAVFRDPPAETKTESEFTRELKAAGKNVCLRCERPFATGGNHNRVCPRCKTQNEQEGP